MLRASVLPVMICILAGCAERPRERARVPVYAVDGRLVVAERPAGNSRVIFHPMDKGSGAPRIAVGTTQPDGTFRLTTYTHGDGAPAGHYVVTVVWVNEEIPIDECEGLDLITHDRLCGQYADAATSTLRATVAPRRNAITIEPEPGGSGWNLPRRSERVKTKSAPD